MQSSVPELVDLSVEPAPVLEMYGDDVKKSGSFTHSLLLARRLVERGVRAVQILHRGWDQHGNLPADLKSQCLDTDQATAALVKDLKARGMLNDTLVVWGGEFGRLPISQPGGKPGRDHNQHANTVWLAGGGVKAGYHHGATDEVGFKAADDKVTINDLHATILHLLGMQHDRLTFRYNGRDFRLTDVAGEVIQAVLA